MANNNLIVGLVMVGASLWVFSQGYLVVSLFVGVVGALMLLR